MFPGVECRGGGGSSSSNRQDKHNKEEEDSEEDDEQEPPYFTTPKVLDPFVDLAPLIMAATCQDGSVALVAVHTQPFSNQENKEVNGGHDGSAASALDEEPFLYDSVRTTTSSSWSVDRNGTPATENATHTTTPNATTTTTTTLATENIMSNNNESDNGIMGRNISSGWLYNLPRPFFGGPTRISNLNGNQGGLALLATGWRADCEALTVQGRKIVQTEHSILGIPPSGHMLASELSLFLAQRAGSEHVRFDALFCCSCCCS